MVGLEFGGASPSKEQKVKASQRVSLSIPALTLGLICPFLFFGVSFRSTGSYSIHHKPLRHDPGKTKRIQYYKDRYGYTTPQHSHPKRNETFCGNSKNNYSPYFQLARSDRSASNEDRTIFDLFFSSPLKRNGTYVELGAFDGKTESNSRFFDECLGWKGMLIEANPRMYHQIRKNRPFAHTAYFAPTCSHEQAANGTTVSFVDTIYTSASIKASHHEGNPKATSVEVPCGPLGPLLEDTMPHIDFFSLDVEGAEPLVLATIDFTKVFIEVMIIENWNGMCKEECETRDQTRALMKANGYLRYMKRVVKSDLYIHKDSKLTIEHAKPEE